MVQEKELLEKKMEWLTEELRKKTEELLNTSRVKGQEILELNGSLKSSSEQVRSSSAASMSRKIPPSDKTFNTILFIQQSHFKLLPEQKPVNGCRDFFFSCNSILTLFGIFQFQLRLYYSDYHEDKAAFN